MKPNTMDCDTPEALRFLASACERPIEDEWMRKAADEIERLRAEVAVLKESAAKLHDIAASGAEPIKRRRMLDQIAEESFAEYG